MNEKNFDINENGCSIRCKMYYNNATIADSVIVCCHGFSGNKDSGFHRRLADRVTTKFRTTPVITFDWPCHGDDVRQKLSLSDCSLYLETVLESIKKRFNTEEIYVCANSFGAFINMWYISQKNMPYKKLVLRSPAINLPYSFPHNIMTSNDMEKLAKGKEALVGFDKKVRIGNDFMNELAANDILECDFLDYADNIIIMHGTKDELIDYDVVAEFADRNVIQFYPINNAAHQFKDLNVITQALKLTTDFFFE